jgi:heme A synthase
MDDDRAPASQISIEELLARAGGLAPASPPPLQLIGWWAFRLLLGFIGLSFLALAVFAWRTYPSLEYFDQARVQAEQPSTVVQPMELVTAPGASNNLAPLALWQEAREQWFAEIKDLGQVFILTPLLPLLGAVLGYIFGREKQRAEE